MIPKKISSRYTPKPPNIRRASTLSNSCSWSTIKSLNESSFIRFAANAESQQSVLNDWNHWNEQQFYLLTDRQRHHAQNHRAGRDQSSPCVALGEETRSHRRADQNANLARRRDVAHGCETHRRKHQDIGKRYQNSDGDGLVLMFTPLNNGLIRVLYRKRREQQRATYIGAPIQNQRRDREVTHRLFVPQSISGDEQSRDHGVDHGVLSTALAQL